MSAKRLYAQTTTVQPERSQAEIRRLLERIDADQFMFGADAERVIAGFRARNAAGDVRYVRIEAPVLGDSAQAERTAWRHVVLYVKTRVTEIQSELLSFDEAFLSKLVLPDGSTVGQNMLPAISEAYRSGMMPALLPGGSEGRR